MSQTKARQTTTHRAVGDGSGRRPELFDASPKLYSATFPRIWRYGFPGLHGWLNTRFAGCRSILDAGTGPGYWAQFLASVNLVIQRARPRPVGSRLRTVRYKHFRAACSLGKWPRARTAWRKRACMLSIAFVE